MRVAATAWGLALAMLAAPAPAYLTNKMDQESGVVGEPRDRFACNQVYYVANLDKVTGTFTFRWYGPDGALQQEDRRDVTAEDGRLWAELKLTSGEGSEFVAGLDPTAGKEGLAGMWRVDLYFGDKLVYRREFELLC